MNGGGAPSERLRNWLKAAEQGLVRAMRHIDRLERWNNTARDRAALLSGRTPSRPIKVFCSWPLVTAPMAEKLIGVSRAAIQRNLAWLEAQGVVTEVTGQGRFRVWRAVL